MRVLKLILSGILSCASCLLMTATLSAQEPTLKIDPNPLWMERGLRSTQEYFWRFSLVATAELSNLKITTNGLVNNERTVLINNDQFTFHPADIDLMKAGEKRDLVMIVNNVDRVGIYSGKLRFRYEVGGKDDEQVVHFTLNVTQPTLEHILDDGNETLNLRGQVGADIIGEFRLESLKGDLPSVQFLPSMLRDGKKEIAFSQIGVEPETRELLENQIARFTFEVKDVEKPGKYKGLLGVLRPGELRSEKYLTIPILLIAEGTPSVAKFPEEVNLASNLVRCANGFTCWLAKRILGKGSIQRKYEIHMENKGSVAAKLQDPQVIGFKGLKGGYEPSANAFTFTFDERELGDGILHPKETGLLSVALNLEENEIPPDEYTGTIRVPVQGQDTPVNIEVDLKVRSGVWSVMTWILFGLLLGRALKLVEAVEARQLHVWAKHLREKIKTVSTEATKENFLTELEEIRPLIEEGELKQARQKLEELGQVVDEELKIQDEGLSSLSEQDKDGIKNRRWRQSWVPLLFGLGSGTAPEYDGSFWVGFGRLGAYAISFFGIVYLGLKQHYISVPTFGADPFVDFGSVLTWALSADIVSRNIASMFQQN